MSKLEILAPAGSKDAFIAAVEAGADAVYCGLKDFSARSKASNFTPAEFYNFTNYAHKKNVKVYAAFNTLIKQNEIKEACRQIGLIAQAGADAVIVQDFGVAEIVKKHFTKLKLHASTQMTIHNSYGVSEAQKAGFARVVLARELSLEEIKSIKSKTDAELEVFCHGALCFGVSGICLMSSFIGGYSGNRGACAQPCRRRWSTKNKDGFYLSPKDLNISEYIRELKLAGVTSLKIEGRMKNPQYVYKTVKAYKILAETGDSSEASELLSQDFARSKTTFNFAGKSFDIFDPQKPKQLGAYIGKILSSKNCVITIKTDLKINQNDVLKAADAKTDTYYKVPVLGLKQTGDIYEIETETAQLRTGMDMFKTADGDFENTIQNIIKNVNIEKAGVKFNEIQVKLPEFTKSADVPAEELFIKINDRQWLKLLKNSGAKIIYTLDRENLNQTLEEFDFFEIPPYIDEAGLPEFQDVINKLSKNRGKSFFLNNMGHFKFFDKINAGLYAGPFLYALNAFAADFLFKRKIKNFVFSYEDDFKNLAGLSKSGPAARGIFYISGFPVLAISKMQPHDDIGNDTDITSAKDSLRVINKDGGITVLPQYPVMLFGKKQALLKLHIRKFLIDLSFIPPNRNYLSSIMDAYNGKRPLQNNFEFNFERGLK